MKILSRLKNGFLELLFPLACVGCGKEGVWLCDSCQESLHTLPPSCFVCKKWVGAGARTPAGRTCPPCREKSQIYAFFSPFPYENVVVREIIHGLKYRYVTSLSPVLGRLCEKAFSPVKTAFPRDAVVIPIPLSPSRWRVRGFNQSEIIGEYLSRIFNLPLVCEVLAKSKKTKPQMELSREERLGNMKRVLVVQKREIVENRDIVLVDDVKTTGATLEEAARVLKEAGAKEIWAVTVAH